MCSPLKLSPQWEIKIVKAVWRKIKDLWGSFRVTKNVSRQSLMSVLPQLSFWRQFPILICSSLLVCWFSAKNFQRMHRDHSWKKEGSGENIYRLHNHSVWWKFFELARIDFLLYGVLMHGNRRTASTAIRTFFSQLLWEEIHLFRGLTRVCLNFPLRTSPAKIAGITSFKEPWKDKDKLFV